MPGAAWNTKLLFLNFRSRHWGSCCAIQSQLLHQCGWPPNPNPPTHPPNELKDLPTIPTIGIEGPLLHQPPYIWRTCWQLKISILLHMHKGPRTPNSVFHQNRNLSCGNWISEGIGWRQVTYNSDSNSTMYLLEISHMTLSMMEVLRIDDKEMWTRRLWVRRGH